VKRRQIVVIEDEAPIRRGLADALTAAGYLAIEAADGETGLVEARRFDVDLVLLDLVLPRMSGLQVLEQLRQTHPHLPVIILTARGSEDDRVRGLQYGADDYVVKPFSARELLARVEAVLRRSPGRPPAVRTITGSGGVVDLQRREIHFADGKKVSLTEMETGILSHLAANVGRAVSREELLTRVWGVSAEALETRAIDMHITRLRSKLSGAGGSTPDPWIVTVRGQGYMLGPNVRADTRDTEPRP
jgi:DNA-binding response OmpR family regulator